jgi:allophanate hydrolase
VWILQLGDEQLAPYLDALTDKDPAQHPLWGIPFAVKDNIDIAGLPTTAGCEAFAYTPDESAWVVQQLVRAGAIPVGKTNLDQFATGLNGTRSPWGACRNSVNPDFISGGSSAGSAVAVALGLASFSLGTDTAGSGRVPACFNNLIGLKPSRGVISNRGVVPACRSLDCVNIFAMNADDANEVLACAETYDAADGYSRQNPLHNTYAHYGYRQGPLTLGIIPETQLKFFGDDDYAAAYQATLEELADAGIGFIEIDYAPFDEAARLLYEGPWVSERYLATSPLIQTQAEALFPVVRAIIEPGGTPRATTLFQAQYRLQDLRKLCLAQLARVDALLTPTAGRLFTIAEMLEEPIRYNSELGYYTNFVNLLDLAAIAVPTQFTTSGLPFGVTLVGNTFTDRMLLSMANRLQQAMALPQGASQLPQPEMNAAPVSDPTLIDIVVCGAHLSGLSLNHQLIERGGVLQQRTHTTRGYRLYALPDGVRPALVRDQSVTSAVEVEVWRLPVAALGSLVSGIPAPLGLGKVTLQDDRQLTGFICEAGGERGAVDITEYGGWRAYLNARNP